MINDQTSLLNASILLNNQSGKTCKADDGSLQNMRLTMVNVRKIQIEKEDRFVVIVLNENSVNFLFHV